ncbi:MAG: flagellar filament capping protein FliD [Ectothiorhodospiraceae bacterium]|nr:flagellar filament capping protein FliD [Ectothiorhodospiraceae bacterium]
MAGISSMGIGSGIDVRGLVDQLMAAERAPQQNRIDRQQQRIETQLSALGQLRSALSTFQGTVQDLGKKNSFIVTNATTSDSKVLGITAQDGATTGNYDIQVNRLAQAQGLASGAFSSRDAAVGTGSLTFRFGTVEYDEEGNVTGMQQNGDKATRTIQIDPSNNSLQGVRDAVNEADMGVRANIVNDGSGERLVFTSTETGEDNAFFIDVDADQAGSPLERLAFNESSTDTTVTRRASNAELTIDGLTVTRSTNTIDDLIDNVTLDLKAVSEAPIRVGVTRDNSGAQAAIEGFVEAFNALQKEMDRLTRYDPETETAGPLNGNAAARNILSQLRNTISNPLAELEGRSVRSMADVGILTNRSGGLDLNADKLTEALERDPEAVAALFSPTGIVDGQGFSYDSNRSATESGRYAVEVSALATRGRFNGASIGGGPITIEEGSNTFRISVDGTRSEVLTLRSGTYDSMDAVARELQALINGSNNLRDAGRQISVTFDEDNNRFSFMSGRYGSESTVSFSNVAGPLQTALGISGGESVTGTDVQGTIGGREAEGFGQYLTGLTGPAEGLKLKVDGTQTGSLGEITFSRGMMGELDKLLDSYISSSGTIRNQTDALNGRLDLLKGDQERLERRMGQVEARYVAQFTAMDRMIAQMNETSQFLTQQLAALQPQRK